MPNIILIGFMGSGKDCVGRVLARQAGLHFFSTDACIEFAEERSIAAIFQSDGEAHFRSLERELLRSIGTLRNCVIAIGGGMVIEAENRELLGAMGTVVQLRADLDILEERLSDDTARPLASDRRTFRRLYRAREGLYDFAAHTIETDQKTPDMIAGEICSIIGLGPRQDKSESESLMVKTESRRYPVTIGDGLIRSCGQELAWPSKRALIVTNPIVGTLFLEGLRKSLAEAEITTETKIIPDGEEYKSLATALMLYDFLLEGRFDRRDMLIALGGGVIGDIAGFVASTYKRGMPFVQIPTTLLSQVDASVGGKTGVNHALGKNMIGTFYQPRQVLIDITTLETLPDREFRNGLAEVIKTALIADRELFELLWESKSTVQTRSTDILQKIIAMSVAVKRDIVARDERETKGIRERLNFGHTIGHIIETHMHYRGMKHGEAMAIGMAQEARISVRRAKLTTEEYNRLRELIESVGLETQMPSGITPEEIKTILMQDKKMRNGRLRIPLLNTIGKSITRELSCDEFLSSMDPI